MVVTNPFTQTEYHANSNNRCNLKSYGTWLRENLVFIGEFPQENRAIAAVLTTAPRSQTRQCEINTDPATVTHFGGSFKTVFYINTYVFCFYMIQIPSLSRFRLCLVCLRLSFTRESNHSINLWTKPNALGRFSINLSFSSQKWIFKCIWLAPHVDQFRCEYL